MTQTPKAISQTAARRETRRYVFGILFLVTAAIALASLGGAWPARAGETVFTAGGAAIDGYDPVAYFKDRKPVEGKSGHSLDWMGATWRFASAENRDTFAAAPEKYAPQYGGFCAWAVSQGYTAKIDPDAWYIENDKLYLNYSKSVQARWAKDVPGNIAKADSNWPKIHAKLAQ